MDRAPSPHRITYVHACTEPGVRVEPEFVSAAEGEAATADAMEIIKRYSISHVTEEQRAFMAGQMKHVPLPKDKARHACGYVCMMCS